MEIHKGIKYTQRIALRCMVLLACIEATLHAAADTSVGTPAGSFSVSETGAAVYAIPFDVSPSGTGFDPKIGLAYNSQQTGYGNAGYGVSITGISCITRAGKDRYHDGDFQKVRYMQGDNYLLDGKRLYLKDGTQGTDGSTYTVEGNPYATVTLHGNDDTGNYSMWFELKDADGNAYQYQKWLYIPASGIYRTVAWYVTTATNKYGDTINYSYTNDANVIYPLSITYGRAGCTNSIEFSYESLAQPQKFIVEGGIEGQIAQRLYSVTTKYRNNTNRVYTLSYSTSDASNRKFDRLVSVNVKNGNGEFLKPITLNWKYLESAKISATSNSVSTEATHLGEKDEGSSLFISADVNNDGVSDVIRMWQGKVFRGYNIYGAKVYNPSAAYIYISRSQVDTNGKTTYTDPVYYDFSGISYDFGDDFFNKTIKTSSGGSNICNLDGDSYNDIVLPYYYIWDNDKACIFYVIRGSDAKAGNQRAPGPFKFPLDAADEMPLYCNSDINGDGKDELIFVEQKKNSSSTYSAYIISNLNFSNGNRNAENFYFQSSLDKEIKKMFLVDCNADGLQDIVLLFEDGYKIYFNNGGKDLASVFTEVNSKEVTNSSTLKYYWRMEQGDFDGDGLLDFVASASGESKLRFIRNQGDGTFLQTGVTDVDFCDNDDSGKDDEYFAIRVVDFDKDGRSDVMVSKMHQYDPSHWYESTYYRMDYTQMRWFLSDGTKPVLWKTCNKKGDNSDNCAERYIFTGDFDGDGYAEIANYGSDLTNSDSNVTTENQINIYSFSTDISLGHVASITDGFGKKTTITYASGTNPSVYTAGDANACEFPVNTYTLPLPLVSHVNQTNGAAASQNIDYHYGDLRAHVQGRGLLGFSTMSVSNTTLGTKTDTKVTGWDANKFIPSSVLVTTTTGGRTSRTTSENGIDSTRCEGNYFSYCKSSTTEDFDNHTTKTEYAYDLDKGVLTQESTFYDGSQNMYKKTDYKNYVLKAGRYVSQTVTETQKHSDDDNEYTVTDTYTYNDKGDVVQDKHVSEYPGEEDVTLTTDYTRDAYGNVLSELTTGGVANVTKYNEYDAQHLRLTKTHTDPSSVVNTYTYDTFGNVIEKRDESNPSNILTTTYTYDGWGNCVLTTTPEGVKTETKTAWNRSYSNSVYATTTTTDGSATVTVAYDSEGRKVASNTKGKLGVDIVTTLYYNYRGKPSYVETRTGSRCQYESISYDNFGRVTYHRNMDGTTCTYSYDDRKVTEKKPTGSSVKTYDAWGNVISVQDEGCEVTYTYNSFGQPSTATTGKGSNKSTVAMEYDGAGRRKRLTDPDAGTQICTYAADGMILSQTDGNGITTEYSYDGLGRLKERRCGDDIDETIEYGESGNSLNHIAKKECNSNIESYVYDPFGRIITDTRTCNGDTYVKSYQYDTYGRVSKVCYPGDVVVDYSYDPYGYLQTMSANGKCVFTQQSYNGTSDVTLSGELTSTDSFSSYGLVTSQLIESDDEIWDKMDYTYFSTTGNIKTRTRYDCPRESFTYDDADRLTVVESDGRAPYDEMWADGVVEYDDKGNITYKTGIGNYDYSTSKPHAVSGIYDLEDGISQTGLSTAFNDDGKMESISCTSGAFVNRTYFYYGPDREKWETTQIALPRLYNRRFTYPSTHHFYFGDYERITKNSSVTEQYFLDNGVILVQKDGELNFYKAFSDIQGSILSVYGIDSGEQVFRASYDAWGRQVVEQNDIDLSRGYCGHDMLADYELIDMGGRVYDPVIGRFLSCDNYVQEPDNSQNFNRYSYCLNNPLRYTDPSGELFGIDDAFWIFTAFSVASSAMQAAATGQNVWKAMGISALSSAATYGIGQAFGNVGSIWNEVARAGAHGLSSGLTTSLEGGNFWSGFASGAVSSGIGSYAQGVHMNTGLMIASTTVMGGLTSWATGSDPWQGAMNGLLIGALNHAQHDPEAEKVRSRAQMKRNPQYKQKVISKIQQDGKLTFEEAYYWYGYGDGSDIHVDASKLNLGKIDVSGRKIGESWSIQTLTSSGNKGVGLVYGSITVEYRGNNTFRISPDTYDFDIHTDNFFSWSTIKRNLETIGASILHGTGTPFKIIFNGLYYSK